MAIYFLTFLFGLIVDSLDSSRFKNIRILFIFWLFVFLCFSYTNGSDWRSYELDYYSGYQKYVERGMDFGFVFIMRSFKTIISDFWLTLGVLKIIYLCTCMSLFKLFTDKWISATVMMMPLSLLFMIIDNPLRYMVAMTFFNLSMICIIKNRIVYAILLSLLSLTCHQAIIICLPFLLLLKTNFISSIKSPYLIAIYISLLILSNQIERMQDLQLFGGFVMSSLFGREDMLLHYGSDEPENLLNLGTIINFALFLVVIIFRKKIIRESGNNSFSLAVLYFYIFNLSHALPVGHRLRVPMTFFGCIAFTYIIYSRNMLRYIVVVILASSMIKMINNTYQYIPYTNSIPYILIGHKPYNERFNYNVNNYKERTGHSLDND